MPDLSRRGFLSGVVSAVAAGTAMVKLASPEETQYIKTGQPASILEPVLKGDAMPPLSAGRAYLAVMTADGLRYQMVGWMTRLDIVHSRDCLTEHHFGLEGVRTYPGLRHTSADLSVIVEHQEGEPW
jgi:hypothetical protein